MQMGQAQDPKPQDPHQPQQSRPERYAIRMQSQVHIYLAAAPDQIKKRKALYSL